MQYRRSNQLSSSIAIGYIRASTGKQRYTVENQQGEFADWSAYNGIPVVESYSDPELTSRIDPRERPGFKQVLDAIKRNKADFLLVVNRDRMGRKVWYMSAIEKELSELDTPCRIIETVDDPHAEVTPATQLVSNIKDAASQYERAMISLRTKRCMKTAAKHGNIPGPKAWATYRRGQLTIQLIKALHKAGFSNGAITRFCADNGILSPHRGIITMAHVRSCLASDYQEADLDYTIASILDNLKTSPYYESRYVAGDETDRSRVRT